MKYKQIHNLALGCMYRFTIWRLSVCTESVVSRDSWVRYDQILRFKVPALKFKSVSKASAIHEYLEEGAFLSKMCHAWKDGCPT